MVIISQSTEESPPDEKQIYLLKTLGVRLEERVPDTTDSVLELGRSREQLVRKTNAELKELLKGVGVRGTSVLRKNQLVDLVISTARRLEDREGRNSEVVLRDKIVELAMSSWFMKFKKTKGMREGSDNEADVLRRIPNFIRSKGEGQYEPLIVGERGLACMTDATHLGASADGFVLLRLPNGAITYCPIEIKTMTATQTIRTANVMSQSYGAFSIVSLGSRGSPASKEAVDKFKKLSITTEYRIQCLHHAIIYNADHVLFVVASRNRIIYMTLVIIPVSLKLTASDWYDFLWRKYFR